MTIVPSVMTEWVCMGGFRCDEMKAGQSEKPVETSHWYGQAWDEVGGGKLAPLGLYWVQLGQVNDKDP